MKTIVLCLILSTLVLQANAAKKYSYFRIGNASDISATTTPGTVLMGGGTDVDTAFQWMCGRSGNGDFLVIRATGTDAYNPYIQQLCPNENSVATLIIPNASAANDSFVMSTIQQAEAIWIAGGDQSNYINFWQGTPVQSALNAAIAHGVPIGGTSAGMYVLSQFVYTALRSQGATSSQSLADPYNRYITLGENFGEHLDSAGTHRLSPLRDAGPHGPRSQRSYARYITTAGRVPRAILPLTNRLLCCSTAWARARWLAIARFTSYKHPEHHKFVRQRLH